MKNVRIKVLYIFIPFLLISVVSIALYSGLSWLLTIYRPILHIKEDMLVVVLPMIIGWIPVCRAMRRRIRILKPSRDHDHFFYFLIMGGVVVISLIIWQTYLQKASYPLIKVNSVEEVKDYPNERYFQVDTFHVLARNRLPHTNSRVSGRNGQNLTYSLFLSCPFESDTSGLWYGVKYYVTMSNYSNSDRKDEVYNEFIENSMDSFERYDFKHAQYFKKEPYSDDLDGFHRAIERHKPELVNYAPIVLTPEDEPFEERVERSSIWRYRFFALGSLAFLIVILFAKIDPKGLKRFEEKKPYVHNDTAFWVELLNPFSVNPTAWLVWANLLVLMYLMFTGANIMAPSFDDLARYSLNRTAFLDGEYWRLLTSMFVHGGIGHLLVNMVGLVLGGFFLIPHVRAIPFLIIYIMCGIAGGLTSIYWHDNSFGVGASGAVFGLYGLMTALNLFDIIPKYERRSTWTLIAAFAGIGFLFGLLGGIDNSAHVGGFLFGFVSGGFLKLVRGIKRS
ncbi:MAG: rhomboid family intramembrane serine protease [Bacteroidia bacterium]|nr:rhomboid family intramembrane serine protease [Bacteroidia bacterium]